MNIMIAVPCMDQVACGFVQSLVMLKKVDNCIIRLLPCSLVYESRHALAKSAIEHHADLVLWLDSDMVFDPDLLERMVQDMEEGKDIVTALCFTRIRPYCPTIYETAELKDGKPECRVYHAYPEDRMFPVQAAGCAVMLMKTEVLRRLYEKYDNAFYPVDGFGEDISFCLRAGECGYQIWCDPRIKVGHIGHLTVTDTLYKAFEKDKAEEQDEVQNTRR